MIWARVLLFLMGPTNRRILDDLMSIACGTMRSYDMKREGPLLDLLVRRWYSKP